MEQTAERIGEWMRLYNQDDRQGLSSRLGMRLIKIEEGYVEDSMPVDERTNGTDALQIQRFASLIQNSFARALS